MSDCIFCKIVAGQIPNHTVYEDDFVLAFLDIFPHAKGHTVIIPKKHFQSLSDMSEEEWQNMAKGIFKTVAKVREVLKPEGLNIGLNDQSVAGQVVPHIHWHIFPRWTGDGGGSFHSIIKTQEKIDVVELAKLF
ncbi:MAG: HIT family protein [Candidatus Magasanikbacteria bacterium CG10_big_fil_rev_8_21_14_0_10_36_32]|uniref:HIT family protein n=1 Tax=Candidatus Magasanikbacteria bacterium CG10_big_fil_rev_8_21_14_0_10_36_32 TaxID=1974646 RepID=A0A2M6W643_9BACT|nr:MAG: HIT family protein [Candidatus Magasanikbacteria bacterium CG10_big_fil_rev_8_21_14_0_10_36_32]